MSSVRRLSARRPAQPLPHVLAVEHGDGHVFGRWMGERTVAGHRGALMSGHRHFLLNGLRYVRDPAAPASPRACVSITGEDLTLGYFEVTTAMITQAEPDLHHVCGRGVSCRGGCDRMKRSARQFLRDLRTRRARSVWADWLALAEARAHERA